MYATFLLTHWRTLLAAAFMTVITGQFYWIKHQSTHIAELDASVSVLKGEVADLQESNTNLRTAISTQNEAVEKFKAAADQRVKASVSLLATANATASSYKAQAESLLARTVPQGTTLCDAADSLVNEVLKNAKH